VAKQIPGGLRAGDEVFVDPQDAVGTPRPAPTSNSSPKHEAGLSSYYNSSEHEAGGECADVGVAGAGLIGDRTGRNRRDPGLQILGDELDAAGAAGHRHAVRA